MNRIDHLFQQKKNNILSIYFTAGHPTLDITKDVLQTLEESGLFKIVDNQAGHMEE